MAWGEQLLRGFRYGWDRDGAFYLKLELEPEHEDVQWSLSTEDDQHFFWQKNEPFLRLAPPIGPLAIRLHAQREGREVQRHPPAGFIRLRAHSQWWV